MKNKETLEENTEVTFANEIEQISDYDKGRWYGRIEGANWQAERMYSEEEVISFAHFYFKEEFNSTMQTSKSTAEIFNDWFKQFKKK